MLLSDASDVCNCVSLLSALLLPPALVGGKGKDGALKSFSYALTVMYLALTRG